MFDTHAHLNFKIFQGEEDEIIKKALASGIEMIIVGADFETSRKAVELAKKYSGVWAAVGLHPINIGNGDWRSEIQKIRELAKEKKVVAIGEVGLDFSRDQNTETQETIFDFFVSLAKELKKPLIFHCRGGKEKMLEKIQALNHLFVWHCFGEDVITALEIIKSGGYISFTGNITFRNNKTAEAVIKTIPLEKIMIETDCPYLAPEPYRGRRNEPRFVVEVAKKIATIKGLSLEETEKILDQNTKKFFKL